MKDAHGLGMGHVSVSHTSVMGVFYLLSAGVRGAKFPILFDAERSALAWHVVCGETQSRGTNMTD